MDGGEGDTPASGSTKSQGAGAAQEPTMPPPLDTNVEAGPSRSQPPVQPSENQEDAEGEPETMDDVEGFDPDTLANLAALSRIDEATGEEIVNYLRSQPGLSPLIDGADQDDADTHAEDSSVRKRKRRSSGIPGESPGAQSDEELRKVEIRGRSVDAEGESEAEFGESSYGEDGKSKRKRNRTVLSCTECHRRCDRNIPCSRCIKRGVPGMCRMEAPPFSERKKKDLIKDIPIDEELGVRIQALESLIRSGSSLDPDSASTAAMETILHATRAANSGSQDATTALAQLTESALSGSGIGGMSADAQSSLLMEVLQQLSSVTQGRNGEPEGESNDLWSGLPTARPDPVARVTTAYNADASSSKLDLSLPGFRDDAGRPFVPPTVRHVEKQLRNTEMLAREALPVWGDDRFLAEGIKFAYGSDHGTLKLEHVSSIAAVQASTLTGALRIAGTFLSRFPSPPGRAVYIPSPTTEEDTATLRDAGLDIKHYRFLDRKTGGVDFEGLQADLQAAPAKSTVLLHVSGSTPTGVEFSETQWRTVIGLLQDRNLIPFVVLASQGLATGDVVKDAQPLRLVAQEGLPVVLCQSFDAMMGLYSESPAIVSVVAQSLQTKSRVESQLRAVARGLHGHPSPWGAQVAHTVLSDSKLHPAWLTEIKAMSDRLRSVREKLFDLLANKFKTPGNWTHIKRSVGMYCTTLLSPLINDHLASRRHVYLLPHGSFSLGSLNSTRIELLARSIDSAVLSSIHEAEQVQAEHIAMELALAAVKEAAAREEAEAAAADAAREEDRMLMEKSIASAIEAQRRAEEEERDREEDERRRAEEDAELDAAVRKAAERAQIARQAEAILASIGAGM